MSWSLILGIGKYVGILAGVAALYFVIDGRGYDRGVASVEKELVEAREQFAKERKEFNARLNRIAGSVKRRCLTGERLPECEELGFR